MRYSTRLRAIRNGRNHDKGPGEDDYRKPGATPQKWWRKSHVRKWNKQQRRITLQAKLKELGKKMQASMEKFDLTTEDVDQAAEDIKNENIS